MNKKILLVIVLLTFSMFIFPIQHAFSSDNATFTDDEPVKTGNTDDEQAKIENIIDEPETPQITLTPDDFEEMYEESFELVEEWTPYDIPPHNVSYNGTETNHLALDSNTTQTEELNIIITHPLNGTILTTKYVNATWNATGDFDYFDIELDNVIKGNTTDTFYYLEIPEGWHTLKITGYSGNLIVFDSVIFDPVLGGGSYELRLHIIEDATKEDYSYCWVKLANEHWNKTAYGQADVNGEITFTEIATGNYYVEIYPPTPSEVYGMRMYCKNITISGDLSLGLEIYDYRGSIAMAWNLKQDETNMTQYILERMEGCGAQEGDIIQINVAWKYPLSPINSNWGKDNFKDLIISLKKEGYRIWIEPRLIYCGSTLGYSFWTQLDSYSDSGYADGNYYNEASGQADFRAHNAFMQFEARKKSLENEGPTGDISLFLGDVAICLKQKDYWDVYDVDDAQYLTYGNGPEQWSFDNDTCILTIHDATQNHLYEIYYMEGYHRLGAPIGNYDGDPYFVRSKLLELMEWYYENCTLPNGESAIDGIHPNYGDARALGVWNAWNQGWSGMVTKKVIDWFLGNYTQYKDDFKLSWVTFEENSAFPRGRNDSLPFMNDWLYFREKLIHDEWYKLLINQAKNYNACVVLYDGDDNRLQSSELAIRLGADIFEHQKGTNIDDEYFINYVDYWSTRVPFMNDWEETWQDNLDHEGLRATLQRTSAQGTLPAIMYNHQSPYGYNIPEDRYDDYRQAHEDFREVWKTYKQFSDRKIAKVYIMVGVSARQISDFYGAADGTRMTPRLYHKSLFFRLPAQLDFISTYYIEENGIPDDCDLLVIAGKNTGSPDTTYHSLYSDKLNSTVTSYVMDGGAVWFMGDVGRYSTNGTNLGTGYWEQLLGLQCVNASWDDINDNFFVDESHWIINDEEYRGLIENSEGYQPNLPNTLGEPEWEGLRVNNFAEGMYNVTNDVSAEDVIIWYGGSSWKMPYLYIRDDIGDGYVAYSPFEASSPYPLDYPMGGRLFETFMRTFYYLTNNTDKVCHVNVTLDAGWVNGFTRDKYMYYTVYNNSYATLVSIYYDAFSSTDFEVRSIPYHTTNVNLSDFMDANKDYLIYVFDRPNSNLGYNSHILDSVELSETNKTLVTDDNGDVLFQKGERFKFTFEREIVHWFIIKEVKHAYISLIYVKASDNIVSVTNEGAVGNIYVINATAYSGTNAEFIVYCNLPIASVTINGASVLFNHNFSTKILSFNHVFTSNANIEIESGPDTTSPSISSPVDFSYEAGQTGNSILWTITEPYSDKYNITRNGELVQIGSYYGGVTLNIDGLSVGGYTYIIFANDSSGNSASDSIYVTVTPDVTAPSINSPSDMSYEIGTTGNTITWIIDEPHPDYYNVTTNGKLVQSGSFIGGAQIIIDVDGLSIGDHTYIITANDTFGNSASDIMIVIVIEPSQDDDNSVGGGGGDQDTLIMVLKAIISFSKTSVFQGEQISVKINVIDDANKTITDASVELELLGKTFHCDFDEDEVYTCVIDTTDLTTGLHEIKITVKKDGYSTFEETKSMEIKERIIPDVIQNYISESFLPIRVGMMSIILGLILFIVRDKVLRTRHRR